MIITTTNSVDGFRIVNYFAPVVASVVAGTGLFGDVAARFTDVLGGRSETYQNYLESMHAIAMSEIEVKSEKCGANAAVGARFEFSQVSGKGMQMLMMNAVATPVLIKTEVTIADEAEAAAHAEALASEAIERKASERRARLAIPGTLGDLLAEPDVAESARHRRRVYGNTVAAEFLTGKAEELGYAGLEFDADDIPDLL